MAWNRSTMKVADVKRSTKRNHFWHWLVAGLIVVAMAGVAILGVSSLGSVRVVHREVVAAGTEEELVKPKKSVMIREVKPAPAPVYNVVAERLQGCRFLVNQDFKKRAKVYLCLFSASWCPPCRAEMPRIAKIYAETLKSDRDIELIHFSYDSDEGKAMSWAKEHEVQFPVVKPKGGNPLDLHSRGIPHLFIVKSDGTLVEEGHPASLFTEKKLSEIKRISVDAGGGKKF